MLNQPAIFSVCLPFPDNIPSSDHQKLQRQLLIDIRRQRLSFKKTPISRNIPIGSECLVYDKFTKTWPDRATIVEKLRNSTYMVEMHKNGALLSRHVRMLKIAPRQGLPTVDLNTSENEEDNISLP